MRTEAAKICAALLGLVVCAAAQDLAPCILGAKPPVLLLFGCCAGIPAAIGAGLFADALGGLPFGCSAFFYAVAALAVRFLPRSLAIITAILFAAAFQLWVALWGDGGHTVRTLAGALATALLLAPTMFALVSLARRRIGLDVQKEDAR